MSQNMDNIQANNLSAPEDAFDQFQASTVVVEEDEFITLADIVPPEPPVPYLSGDPNEIPYDNEVILTNLDDHFSDANSQSSQLGYDDGFTVDTPHLDMSDNMGAELTIGGQDTEDDHEVSLEPEANSSLNTPEPDPVTSNKGKRSTTKRGRSSNNNNSLLTEISPTETPSVSKRGRRRVPKKIIEPIIEPPKTTRPRRGRQKKSEPSDEAPVSNENEVSDFNETEEESLPKKSAPKRGRSKKVPPQDTPLDEEPTPNIKPTAKKRGRNKKVPVSESSNSEALACPQPQHPDEELKFVDLEDIPVHTITNFKKLQNNTQDSVEDSANNDFDDQDDSMDGIALSDLRNTLDQDISSLDQQMLTNDNETHLEQTALNGTANSANETANSINDSEICKENGQRNDSYLMDPNESLLVEDTSKRPKRQRVKQQLVYDEGSDEDPYANMELSDDEPKKRKGKRYYSDDEYVPGKKIAKSSSDPSDSDIDLDENCSKIRKKKLVKTPSKGRSPRKMSARNNSELNTDVINVTTVTPKLEINPEQADDIEVCLQSSVIKAPNEAIKKWGNTFENFIANKIQTTSDLKIEKVSSDVPSVKAQLEIPTIDMEAKKRVDSSSQTDNFWKSVAVQTSSPYEVSMKDKVNLTPEQSVNACQFLKSIVGTTSELGQLMTQKSEDFINKKINTTNVVDTFKMDYCVKKSFLLLKLAKHNINQMEEDLSKKYEDFLRTNNLLKHREEIKQITAKDKSQDDDSDCEIVGESVPGPSNATAAKKSKSQDTKSNFNPKTVFLNKELSIKIAKKEGKPAAAQDCKEKLNIKGRHTVWISDSVMVKKVKPTQSFLAQDSRNKKPPDTRITEKMVSDFFKTYYRAKLLANCAQFTSADWIHIDSHELYCYYFEKCDTTSIVENNCETLTSNGEAFLESTRVDESNTNGEPISKTEVDYSSPDTLLSLCTNAMRRHLKLMKPQSVKKICEKASDDITDVRGSSSLVEDVTRRDNPQTLFRLCLNTLAGKPNHTQVQDQPYHRSSTVVAIKEVNPDVRGCASPVDDVTSRDNPQTLLQLCVNTMKGKPNVMQTNDEPYVNSSPDPNAIKDQVHCEVLSLKQMCSNKLIALFSFVESCHNLVIKDTDPCNNNIDQINKTADNADNSTDDLADLIDNIINDPIYKLIGDRDMSDHSMEDLTDNESRTDVTCCSVVDDDDTNITQLDQQCGVKSLFSLCVALIGKMQTIQSENHISKEYTSMQTFTTATLKQLAFKKIKWLLYKSLVVIDEKKHKKREESCKAYQVRRLSTICFEIVAQLTGPNHGNNLDYSGVPSDHTSTGLTINCVNTMTEEAFHNIQEDEPSQNASQFSDDETNFYEDFDQEYDNTAEGNETEENNWMAQVQMEVTSGNQIPADDFVPNGNDPDDNVPDSNIPDEQPVFTRVKMEPEPVEDPIENVLDTSIVKTEPTQESTHDLDQMTIIPESIMTKREQVEEPQGDRDALTRQKSFDSESFEAFVRTNKMMYNTNNDLDESSLDGIFSQSAFRVRRQFEPDYRHEADEFDPMSLLVPQTFEPLSIETAKNHLMNESSSDESNKEATAKKKPEKRGRKSKKQPEAKTKEVPAPKEKENPPATNELAVLTRRMREKIRQEEKKVESSDSEQELSLSTRREKTRKDSADKGKKPQKPVESDIQVNDVDSTEQIDSSSQFKISPQNEQFSGFTAVDQNEITSYQKYVKYVYDKIVPSDTPEPIEKITEKTSEAPVNSETNDDRPESPLINYEDPVELLECEPTMPIFDDDPKDSKRTRRSDTKKSKAKTNNEISVNEKAIEAEPVYKVKDGWHCYSVPNNETKLYKIPKLYLEKLPESFVQTYFRYQDMTAREKEDEDINRLINLNTLNRSTGVNAKDMASRKKAKGKGTSEDNASGDVSRADSPDADNYAELTPSEDEGANVEDELPPPVRQTSDNVLAKSSLMNEQDSDSDAALSGIKTEHNETTIDGQKKTRSSKSKKMEAPSQHPENVMLTADMSMNKELNLLHAPVILKHDTEDISPKSQTVKKHKSGHKPGSARDRTKNEDDSSSEEEKQWVTTKEKLLKRMGKKDTASVDDAKRTKLVTEFIERRGGDEGRTRKVTVKKKRLSMRRRLEREKQLRVLSNELYDNTNLGQKKVSQSYFKGRRNIRKVIDKKSLTRSTVIANMEEFERKCRLNERQSRLRELLGLEEGVNVVVINDEVCLEYDFEEQEPVVTVHPFFTRVMKAHQYEGVKFMWDACFESLDHVESGGGGCILAHCMGLGKTLQVLALLHTVLTHPRVGMQRVLVCCPLSTVLNWVDEINKWIGPVTHQIKVFELSKLKKTYERAYQLEDWYNGGGIFIIGYELFRSMTTLDPEYDDVRPTIVNKIRTALLDPGPDIVVCDEGHLLKNDCSVLAVAMSRVKTKRRIILTGTPMQNNLREYYCMVNFVKPNLLGTYSEFSNRFENPIMNGQHRDSREEDIKLMKQRTHILHKVLEGCLQRQEASVLYPYLPKKHEYTVFISLTPCQWDLYKHYLQNYGKENNKQSVLRDFHTLQKIWSHPKVLHNFQTRSQDSQAKLKPEKIEDDLACEDLESEDIKPPTATEVWWTQYLDGGNMLDSLESSNKFVVVFRILDECISLGDKVLIFSTSLITMDVLEYFLKRINGWSLGHEYYRLDGSVPPEVRQKWCREFNAEHNLKTKLFLISTRAGSLGLNMVAANRVIILDTSWNPAHDIQSIFRVYRFGQKKDCYIYRLVAMGTMEQKIYERSVTKQAVACRVVDEQQIDRHYNMAELTELYKYDDMGTSVPGGVAVGVTDVALLRVARLPALHAVHEHDSLLRGSSEQELPDHERAAAWMQFQQEHATKQMQNQLTSSFALHIPRETVPEVLQAGGVVDHQFGSLLDQQYSGMSLLQPLPEVKAEPTVIYPPAPEKGKKGKKPVKSVKVNIPIETAPETPEPGHKLSEAEVEQKIMHLLIKHNVHVTQTPKEIANLVANVRKIVAHGRVPEGTFTGELTEGIANVLLGKDTEITDATQPAPTDDIPKRGRPRKTRSGAKQAFEQMTEPEPVPSTSTQPIDIQEPFKQYVGRRRAAIVAEKNLSSVLESVIDLDDTANEDTDDAWQGNNSDSDYAEEIAPQTTKADASQAKSPKKIKTEKTSVTRVTSGKSAPVTSAYSGDTITLSDEEAPLTTNQQNIKKNDAPKEKEPTEPEVIPLHPSLLTNKNFIKIVAHTYLEGNPMLDDDAANMAAQYSTTKALKEFESTGKPIVGGPIYDIATKVLGIDILTKLHKTNPKVKTLKVVEEPVQVKQEDAAPAVSSAPASSKPRPMPRVKAKGIEELMVKKEPEPRTKPGKKSVVPVGMYTRLAPAQAPVPVPQPPTIKSEESILPDDDDVIISDSPAPSTSTPQIKITRKNAQPLLINSIISKSEVTHPNIIKLVPGGKIVLSKSKDAKAKATPAQSTAQPQAKAGGSQDTICLDSDEEEAPPPKAKEPKRKMVALKSTAKLAKANPVPVSLSAANQHQQPVPVSLTAANRRPIPVSLSAANGTQPEPVPVSLTAANRRPMPVSLSAANPNQPEPVPVSLTAANQAYPIPDNMAPMHNQYYTQQQMQTPLMAYDQMSNRNLYMMPTSQANQMPPGGLQRVILRDQYLNPQPTMTSGGNIVYSTPQGQFVNPQQYQNMMNPQGLMMNTRHPMNMMSAMPQHMTMVGNNLVPMSQNMTPVPQNFSPAPQQAAQSNATSAKTVCKPGDILRITASGKVEILNKAPPPDNPPAPPLQQENPVKPNARKVVAQQKESPAKPQETASQKKDRVRKISSSSSSSSDSSRASSPDNSLSIFKDIVHIKSVEDILDSSKSKKSTPTKSAHKPAPSLNKTMVARKPEQTPKPTPPKQPASRDTASLTKQISKTDTILKKLDSVLGPSKQTTKRPPPKPTPGGVVTVVDLDDEPPTASKSAKEAPRTTKPTQQAKPKSQSSLVKPAPTKLVGTSKSIIISGSGKASLDNSAKKAVAGPSQAKPPPPSAVKKRPAPTDNSAAKKKRAEPMTLKDFNIDDIDDIIELE